MIDLADVSTRVFLDPRAPSHHGLERRMKGEYGSQDQANRLAVKIACAKKSKIRRILNPGSRGNRGVFRVFRANAKFKVYLKVSLGKMTSSRFEPGALPLSDAHATDGPRDLTHLNAFDARERSPVSEHDRYVDPPGR